MKYKIKVEVMQDGNSRYYPMVKKHWRSCWMYILNYRQTSLFKDDGLSPLVHEHEARHLIDAFRSKTLARTYEIPYK